MFLSHEWVSPVFHHMFATQKDMATKSHVIVDKGSSNLSHSVRIVSAPFLTEGHSRTSEFLLGEQPFPALSFPQVFPPYFWLLCLCCYFLIFKLQTSFISLCYERGGFSLLALSWSTIFPFILSWFLVTPVLNVYVYIIMAVSIIHLLNQLVYSSPIFFFSHTGH